MTQQRSRTPEAPYCWQSKTARRMICEYFDGDTFGACCLSVYSALTEIASDEEAESFRTLQRHIAWKACLSVRTVKKAIKELRTLGIIAYQTPKLRGPITFTLLSTRPTTGTTCPTIGTTCPTLGTERFQASVPTVEEHKNKELLEEHREEPLTASAGESSLSSLATRQESTAFVSVAGLSFADRFRATLPNKVSLVSGWRKKWGHAYDALLRLDKRDQAEIERVWQWARRDEFWAPQFQSPLKLRKRNREGVTYYDVFLAKLNGNQPRRRRKDPPI